VISPSPPNSDSSPPYSKSPIDHQSLFQKSAPKIYGPRTTSTALATLTKINVTAADLGGSLSGTTSSPQTRLRNSYFENVADTESFGDAADSDSGLNEGDPMEDEEEIHEWAKRVELFETSAEDGTGK